LAQKAGVKELKVQLPVALHIRLHAVKALQGQPICVSVEKALALYFAQHPLPDDALVDLSSLKEPEPGTAAP